MATDDSTASGEKNEAIKDHFRSFPFFQLMGMELVDVEPGLARVRMGFRPDLCQPAGILHGGAIATLIDTCIAHALILTEEFRVESERGGVLVSVDLRVKYLRPVSQGTILCESRIPRLGRQIIHADSIVTNEQGKEVARGDSIYMFAGRKSAS